MSKRQSTRSISPVAVKDDSKTINILLLGEAGCGKTTFINATYSYMMNDTIDEAVRAEFLAIIPFAFTFYDSNYDEHQVTDGQPIDSENVNTRGESSTLHCRSYLFCIGKLNFRLIDTPGIGDTRGYEHDTKNFQIISNYISSLTHLNAILFMIKPDVTRLNTTFKYCFNELLCHLNKSARNHIAFIFTFARSTHFTLGSTKKIIDAMLAEYHAKYDLELDCSMKNCFFFDNEGFRYLALLRQGLQIPNDMQRSFTDSWDRTRKEYVRLARYLSSRQACPITDTVDLLDAERVIRNLPRPIAHIMQMIQENRNLLAQQKGKRSVQQKKAIRKRLSYPRTVCTEAKCVRVIQDGNETRYEYKTICHDACHLNGIAQDVIGSDGLDQCETMDPKSGKCRACQCSWNVHQHITSELSAVIETLDPTIDIKQRDKDLNQELTILQETCEKLDLFLQQNRLLPINDAIIGYIDYFIKIERDNRKPNDSSTLNQLIQLKESMLESHRKTLSMMEKLKTDPSAYNVPRPNEIRGLIDRIFKLPINGSMIREQVEDIGDQKDAQSVPETKLTLPIQCMNNSVIKALLNIPI